jgi:hypothetical protein
VQRADVGVLVRLAVSEPAPSRIGRRSIRRARVLVRKPDTQRRQRLIRAMAVGTVRVERQSKGLYEQVRRVPGNRGAGGRVTTPSPAPGWYPDPSDAGKRIYYPLGPKCPASQPHVPDDRRKQMESYFYLNYQPSQRKGMAVPEISSRAAVAARCWVGCRPAGTRGRRYPSNSRSPAHVADENPVVTRQPHGLSVGGVGEQSRTAQSRRSQSKCPHHRTNAHGPLPR